MIVGCYDLHLYCDSPRHPINDDCFGGYTGSTAGSARKKARKDGWKLKIRDGIAICPSCNKGKPHDL